MEEILKKIDSKKISDISIVVAVAIVTYYILIMYKTNL